MWQGYIAKQKGNKTAHEVCQDYCTYKASKGTYCIAVCDGASSGIHSEVGAEFVAEYVSSFFVDNFERLWECSVSEMNTLFVELHQSAIKELSKYVVNAGYPAVYRNNQFIADEVLKYSTTLQLIAINDNRMLFYKVGNGTAIAIIDSKINMLSGSDHKVPTDHFTFPSTINTIMFGQFQKYVLSKHVSGFLLFSDGLDFSGGFNDDDAPTKTLLSFLNGIPQNVDRIDVETYISTYLTELSHSPLNEAHDDMSVAILLNKNKEINDLEIGQNEFDFLSINPSKLGFTNDACIIQSSVESNCDKSENSVKSNSVEKTNNIAETLSQKLKTELQEEIDVIKDSIIAEIETCNKKKLKYFISTIALETLGIILILCFLYIAFIRSSGNG